MEHRRMSENNWRSPKTLKQQAARRIVKSFMYNTWEVLDGIDLSEKNNTQFLFQIHIIPNIKRWWENLTQRPRNTLNLCLQQAVDELTEPVAQNNFILSVSPSRAGDEIKSDTEHLYNIFHFFMKLLTLDEVFLDRNYSLMETECRTVTIKKVCSLPASKKTTLVSLIRNSCEKFRMKKLTLFGYLYPEIVVAILENSPDLNTLEISRKNVTAEVIISIGKNCCKLEKLKIESLKHLQNGDKSSVAAITREFFQNISLESVRCSCSQEAGMDTSASFPLLKEYDCNTSLYEFNEKLCYIFLLWYSSRYSLCQLSHNFSTSGFTETILKWLINHNLKKPLSLKLRSICLSNTFLYALKPADLDSLAECLPKLNNISIIVKNRFFQSLSRVRKNFMRLLSKLKLLNSINILANADAKSTRFIYPVLATVGLTLSELHISFGETEQKYLLSILYNILTCCPSLSILSLTYPEKAFIYYQLLELGKYSVPKNCLKELSLRETWPARYIIDAETARSKTLSWLKLLDVIQLSSPELEVLTVSLSRLGNMIVKNLSSNVSTLHLCNDMRRFCLENDNFGGEVSSTDIIEMVHRFPNLKSLYLENVKQSVFLDVFRFFSNTGINVYFGDRNGWPYSLPTMWI